MDGLSRLTAHALAGMLSRGECSSEEIVRALLDVISRRDGAIHGYVSVDAEDAIAQARQADKARAAGSARRLLGVPVAVKDVLNVRGHRCSCASRILEGYTAPYDATAVARLRAEGAVFLGRTNMDEFAMGSTTENSAFGPTRNPWCLECVPGGSSGGSAAVVAADEAIVAIGTDTGGSIRQPASFCGCVGLKPSYGRVSRYGLTAYASSLDQIGPLTKDVQDAGLFFEIMSGHDPMDSSSLPEPAAEIGSLGVEDLKGKRLGLPAEYFVAGMDADVEQCVRQAVEKCRALGAEIVDISLPNTRAAIATYYIIATAEASANLARFDGVRYGFRTSSATDPIDLYKKTRAEGFGAEVKRRIILGTYVLSSGYYDAYYVTAQKVRTLIRRDFDSAFQRCDAILAPVAPTAAYRIGEKSADPLQMYLGDIFTVPVNLAGICGLSVPCGFTGDGLPVGLQIIGPGLGEAQVLRIGAAYEKVSGAGGRRPQMP